MKKTLLAISLLPSLAWAQQQTPNEQVLVAKLLQEIQSGINCGSEAITLRENLAKANARIKELEPKPDTPASPEK